MPNPALAFLQASIGHSASERSPSGLGRWLDGTLTHAEAGELHATYVVREDLCNPAGALHGGAIAAILDDLIGTTVYSLGRDNLYVSTNLAVDYLTPARQGDTVTAIARVVRPGRTVLHVEAEIRDRRDRLVARCTSNLVQTSVPQPTP